MRESSSEKNFFPYYFFEIAIVALFTVEAVLLLAALFPFPVGREIDLSAPYQPRPEWYFLSLYELTKFFPGKWTFVGAALLPGLAFGVVLLAPFLDQGASSSLRDRRGAAVAGLVLLVAVVVLTALTFL